MSESDSRDIPWLDERLRKVDAEGPEPIVVRSPLRPVVERSDPWQVDARRHDFSGVLPALLADPAAEAPSARITVVTDVEEDPVGRVQTAALIARRLAEGGHRVLLVDADLRHVGLSRWMPDRDLDAEGLVDVLQYGASVAAVRRPGPIEGVQILGVGSYRPDGTDLYDEAGVGRLVAQLRAIADVVLVVTPAWLPNDRFHPLLVHADAVVVSLHLDRSLATPLEDLLRYLRGLNVPVAGLVAFAGPDASERRIDDLLRERDPWREAEPIEEEPAASSTGGPDHDDDSPEPQTREVLVPAAGAHAPPYEPEPSPRGFRRSSRDDERSSPVFRFVLIGTVVVLLAFVGWWGLTQREHPGVRPRPTQRPVGVSAGNTLPSTPAPSPVDSGAVDTRTATSSDSSAVAAAETTAVGAASPAGDDATTPIPSTQDDAASAPTRPRTAPAEDLPTVDTSSETVPEPAPVAADTPATTPSRTATSDWEVDVAREVGGGYALHIFSFPDSLEAVSALPRLERLGWRPTIVGADIPDKGRWYRILVGRFADRAAALAAREPVGERVGADWVGVVRVP